ncbi:hypothetical protein TNIN_483781 [Trichonephila inaurata madagascariensis]|uniref:Uncharacterized protein n=1 Tax=Trichonephila inaurata madagascariensis TaxID=2747483 RepID=A0A8X6WWL3_9ARAC|nr:hypothetical protein TNIN_483781 [Trichonephila inaurata madagascariensis]
MSHLPHSHTLAREKAVWPCISHAVPFATPGHLLHLSNLQSTIERPINTTLSLRKMGEWLLERSIARDRKHPDSINHVVSCLERFAKDAKNVWAFSEEEEMEIDEKVCGYRHFQPMPREMYGHRKLREGFYDSVFEKPDMWE